MTNERSSLDLHTPSLTPITNPNIENGEYDNGSSSRGGEKVEYTLKPSTRAYASTARLDLQHYLWKDQTGYLLHPSIPLSSIQNVKIADVGTGTGIWLLDLARTLPPTAQLDGFDIDISDCPHEQWLPPNVTMRHLDALAEIPKHLVGAYDIVQLRLFQVVVKDNDPKPLLLNMLQMLKPGGYLQWGEYDMTTIKTIKASPSLSSTALDAIPAFVQGFQKKDARVGVQNWIPTLPTTFHANPLIAHTTSTRHPTTPPFLPSQLSVFLLTYEELAAKTFDRIPGGHAHGDQLRALVEAASQEARKGVAWGMDRLVVVGRKAGGDDDAALDAGFEEERVRGTEGAMAAVAEEGGQEVPTSTGVEDARSPSVVARTLNAGKEKEAAKGAGRRAGSWWRVWKRVGSS